MFAEEDCNALMSAFELSADGEDIYTYLETIPKTSLVVELIQSLESLGYKIIKTKK